MWPYTQEENDLLSKTNQKENTQEPTQEDLMDWAEIYGHENFRKN